MSGVCCRFIIWRNVCRHYQKQNILTAPFFITSYLPTRHTHNSFDSIIPLKLAYASYETMKGNKEVSKLPIMIMHGLFGSKTNWNSLSKAIHQQTDRKVITVDARNHGDSPHSAEMSYKHMAKDIVQLMNDLGFEKSTLIGHSMGGSAMMYVALHYPERVEKLIVVDMSPVRTSPSLIEMQKVFRFLRNLNFDESDTLSKARRKAEEQLADIIKPKALRQFLTMNLVEADIGKFQWRVNLPTLEQNFATQIAVFPTVESKAYKGPTLFIGGGNSDYIKREDHNKIKKLFPTADIVYISDAHHWVHVDKPSEFLKMTVNFINKTSS